MSASGTGAGQSAVRDSTSVAGTAAATWSAVLGRLDLARAAAFAGTGALSAADVPDGPAAASDEVILSGLRARGLHVVGGVPVLVSVVAQDRSGSMQTLAVGDTLPSYRYLNAAGQVEGTAAGRGLADWSITLQRVGAGWLIDAVSPVG